jgi:hypothetical protein
MKKKFIKGILVAMLVIAGTYSSSKLYAQAENPIGTWRTVTVDNGYWENGIWVHVSYCILCGNGLDLTCTPNC